MMILPPMYGLYPEGIQLSNFWAWGDRTAGVQGDGLTTPSLRAPDDKSKAVYLLTMSVFNSAGYINTANELWVTGANGSGQLGVGDTTQRTSWTQVAGAWKSYCVNDSVAYAVKTDGTLWHAGAKSASRDGAGGTTGNNTSFVQIGSDTDWESVNLVGISAGTCGFAIKTDKSIYSWGGNAVTGGSAGTGSSSNVSSPTRMIFQDGSSASAKAVAGTTQASIIIGLDDKLYASGGAVYNGLNSIKTRLNVLDGGNTYQKIKGGCVVNGFFAQRTDNSWIMGGSNSNGQMGDNSTTNISTFSQFDSGATTWRDISLVLGNSLPGCIGLKNDGTLWGWGSYYCNGLGGTSGNTLIPTQIGTSSAWQGMPHYGGIAMFAWRQSA